MMASTVVYGRMQSFVPSTESISAYLERLDLYFTANGIESEKQVPVLLTVIGPENYTLLRGLVAPAAPKDKTLEELKASLTNHFEPKTLVIAERFRFYRRTQIVGESVAEFVAALRKLSIHCKFGDFLDEALRDRLVCGLRDETTQKRLLAEAALDLAGAITIAQSIESAGQKVKEINNPVSAPEESVMRIKPTSTNTGKSSCHRCGRHPAGMPCRFKDATCHRCGKVGHIAPVCRKKGSPKKHPPSQTQEKQVSSEPTDPLEDIALYNIHKTDSSAPPIHVTMQVNQKSLKFEVDTGAAVSVISESTRRSVFPDSRLWKSDITLRTYTGEAMTVLGELRDLTVEYRGQCVKGLSLMVVKGTGSTLLGRDWLSRVRLDWPGIKAISQCEDALKSLLDEFSDVFAPGVGTIKGFEAKLHIPKEAHPKFFKPRTVPFALREAVEEELARLEQEGVIKRVKSSDWAAPIVCVPKKNGKVRICGDFKVTANRVLEVDQYPLPRPEDIFARLAGGKRFSTLDLSQAYHQLMLDEESRKLVTVNTHRGLFQYQRLPFGIASAPAVFQQVMDTILQDIPGTMCYLDDIIVTGSTEEEHLRNLRAVLERLRQHGIRLNQAKCEFMQSQVEYLGHKIDAEGIHATDSKLEAILQAPTPKNVHQLRSFLGLLNYYCRFIPNLASIIHPLNELLHKDHKWKWSKQCDESFRVAKEKLISPNLLVHFDPSLPVKVAGDASAYGVGAVISHVMPDNTERPIAFASHTLTSSERNYSQVEKEALALVFAVRKFHTYLYGRKFVLVTDHKPLTTILGPKKGIPVMAAARLQRWALILSAYSYEIEFRPTDCHANADGLSRLPLSTTLTDGDSSEPHVFNISQMESLPVTRTQLRQATRNDQVLSQVLQYMQKGWPVPIDAKSPLYPFSTRKLELTVEEGCLLWGMRVIVPSKLRSRLLQELHRDHPGISRMKQVARSYIWWPGLDGQIEKLAKSCETCLAVKHKPPVAPLQPWNWPAQPWKRVHLDFAGPFQGSMFLVCVDAHSKWPEVHLMSSTTTTKTLEVLRNVFSAHGLPEQLVTDNGPQFVSDEFAAFVKLNGIKHIRIAPYHPASNGLAERFVQSLKQSLKATVSSGLPLSHRVANFLLTYRTTPHATTGVAPCTLFLRRSIRTRFDLLRPSCTSRVTEKQALQKDCQDRHSQDRSWYVGERVMVRNVRPGMDWIPGVILERLGPVTYLVDVKNSQIWKRHADQIKSVAEPPFLEEAESSTDVQVGRSSSSATTAAPEQDDQDEEVIVPLIPPPVTPPDSVPDQVQSPAPLPPTSSPPLPPISQPRTEPRYPRREHRPPDRFC